MEKTLIIAATEAEIAPFLQQSAQQRPGIDILVTGVGMVATAFAVGQQLALNHYRLLLNVGIAGSFDRRIPVGQVVHIHQDTIAELGAEDGEQFLDSESMGLATHTYYGSMQVIDEAIGSLHRCRGITVNRVHGHEPTIAETVRRLRPQTESMEGAAVFYAAHQAGIPAVQVRAVSNYVTRRNRSEWQVDLAIENLNKWLIAFARSQEHPLP